MRPPLAAAAVVLALAAAPAGVAAPEDPPPGAKAAVPVERFFAGRVVKVEGSAIELAYDFSDVAQLRDFEASCPFRAIRTVAFEAKDGRLRLQGTGSLRHKAVFDGEAGASAVFTPRRPRDFGFAVTEERESEVFTLYCCYDRYFGLGDGVKEPQNMIIKFLARDPKVNANGLQDWRYCGSRGQKPEIVAGTSYPVAIERRGMESRLTIGTWESRGKETGRDLTGMMVAVYGYDTNVDVDDLVVRGKLDATWAARNGIDLASWKPPAPPEAAPAEAPPAAADSDPAVQRVRAQIAGYPVDTKPAALAALLRDTAVPASLRAEAAEKAKTVGLKRIVPFLVDGLYAADADARRLSFDVLKSLTGKAFGYRPDAPEDARNKAIREVNEYLRKHAQEFV